MQRAPLRAFGAFALGRRMVVAVAAGGMLFVIGAMYVLAWWAGRIASDVAHGASLAELAVRLSLGVAVVATLTAASAARDLALVRLSAGFSSSVRAAMLRSLVRQPIAAIRAQSSGDAVTRVGSDIALLHHALLRSLAIWLPCLITTIALVVATIATSPLLALVTALLVLPVLLVTLRAGGRLQHAVREGQDLVAVLGALIADAMSGVREAKVFRQERAIERRARALSDGLFEQTLREERLALTVPAIVTWIAFVGACGLVLAAVWEFRRGAIDGAGLTRFLVLLAMLAGPLQETARSSSAVSRFRALMHRCGDVIGAPMEPDDDSTDVAPDGDGRLAFDRVTVTFPKTGFSLGPLDLDVAPGETVALVGPSGSGKSTMLELIPRLLEPDGGTLRWDGVDAGAAPLRTLRAACAYVPQEPYFFPGTVRDNLRFAAPQASDHDIATVCRAANVDEFVRRLPGGHDARLERGALNLSVGQRQRLAIARAMLVDPRILLLDEPTAALDEASEQLLIGALRQFTEGRTTLLVTHRPAVLVLAHRIVRLHNGRVIAVEAGPRAGRGTRLRVPELAIT